MEDSLRKRMYIYIYPCKWITMLYSRNWHNIANQWCFNKNKKFLKSKAKPKTLPSWKAQATIYSYIHWRSMRVFGMNASVEELKKVPEKYPDSRHVSLEACKKLPHFYLRVPCDSILVFIPPTTGNLNQWENGNAAGGLPVYLSSLQILFSMETKLAKDKSRREARRSSRHGSVVNKPD